MNHPAPREVLILEEITNHLDGRSLLLQQAGALADDESLATLRQSIYKTRKRSEVDESDNP